MKRVALVVVASLFAMVVACGLNPQPFPPDDFDGSIDASKGGTDATAFGDTGSALDAELDSAPVPESDGGQDADAAEDASDGALDAGDAAIDADDGGSAPDAELD